MDDVARRAQVDEVIATALEQLAADIAPATHSPEELLAPVATLAAKGKRVRALLVLTAYDACGGHEPDRALRVAGAVELFQTAALIHDDVLDRSDTRRGMPSTHRSLEALHSSQGWLGDPERFGTGAAILAGDLALMACHHLLTAGIAGLPGKVASAVGGRFSSMATLCTAGQYLDIRLAAQPLESLGAHTDAIVATMRAKTASYTAEGPLALGAALAGLPPETVDEWAAVGVPLGIAFQLRDDLLGAVGAPETTGKPAGDDVREGKRTLLLSLGLDRADAKGREVLMAAVGNESADASDIAAAVGVLRTSGAVQAVEERIDDYAQRSREALGSLVMDDAQRARLEGLIDSTVSRAS
ncbi:polyprenyl synthetase family protein [Demequina sp.]|uniref:polyprenyl synthetase family protein n=1 Tax=Demequina sp. TaxID=2050685 RepID=UPI0025BEBFA8|nr:polyprenyl synthetase family protein [Demequina sp.]